MSESQATPQGGADALAAEWEAALAEAKPEAATELHQGGDQVAPAAFANFAPASAPPPRTTST